AACLAPPSPSRLGSVLTTRGLLALLALLTVTGCSSRTGHPARIAVGYISHVVCSYVFVSGLDPARVREEDIQGNPVFDGFHWLLHHEVDQERHQVVARTPGWLRSRAVYHDGLGCLNLNGAPAPDVPTRAEIEADGPIPSLLPEIAGPEIVAPGTEALTAAVDRAFSEPAG